MRNAPARSLQAELKANGKEIARKRLPSGRTRRTRTSYLGASGVFLLAPWFFMDLKGKEAAETEALERRNSTLAPDRRPQLLQRAATGRHASKKAGNGR